MAAFPPIHAPSILVEYERRAEQWAQAEKDLLRALGDTSFDIDKAVSLVIEDIRSYVRQDALWPIHLSHLVIIQHSSLWPRIPKAEQQELHNIVAPIVPAVIDIIREADWTSVIEFGDLEKSSFWTALPQNVRRGLYNCVAPCVSAELRSVRGYLLDNTEEWNALGDIAVLECSSLWDILTHDEQDDVRRISDAHLFTWQKEIIDAAVNGRFMLVILWLPRFENLKNKYAEEARTMAAYLNPTR